MSGGRKCRAAHNRQNRGQLRFPYLIDKIEVNLDFHIFDILDFDLLIGSMFEKLLTSQESLDKKLRKTASATVSCLENSMAKHFPKSNPLEEMMHESPFIPSEFILFEVAKSATFEENNSEEILHFCEDELSSSLLTEFEHLPAGLDYVVLDHDRDSTMIFDDKSLQMENSWAKEFFEAPTLDSEGSIDEHGNFNLEIAQKPCSSNTLLESGTLSAPYIHEDNNQLKVLFCKIFRRMVVDVYVYRKHCRFRGCTWAITL